jgi:PKD repeat protein
MVPFAHDVTSCFNDESSSASILISSGKPVLVSKPVVRDFKLTDFDSGAVIYDLKNGLTAPLSVPKGTRLNVFADVSAPSTLPYVTGKLGLNPLSSNQMQVYKAEVFYNSKTIATSEIIDRISASKPLLSESIQWNYYASDFGFERSSPFNISSFSEDQYIFSRSGITVTDNVTNLNFRFTNAAGQSTTIVVPNKANVPPVVTLRATRNLSDASKYDFAITATDDKDSALKLNIAWDFGDGATQTGGFTTTHQYAATLDYTATVTVTDSDGASTVVTAAVAPTIAKTNFVDVVFVVDVTGSYTDDIATFKAQAKEIIAGISALGNNVQIGLVSFGDFSDGNPYVLNHQLTYLTDFIIPALTPLTANGGGDLPEADLEALYQLSTKDIGWVGASKKVVLLATDAPFHNSDTEPSYPGHGYTATLAALKAQGIVVYGLVPDLTTIPDMDKIAADTGGKVFTLGAGSAGIVDAIKGISTAKALGKRLVVPNGYVVGSEKQGKANQ